MENNINKRLFIIANTTHYLNVKTYIDTHPPGENFIILTITLFNGYQHFLERVRKDPNLSLLCILINDQNKTILNYYMEILSNLISIKKVKFKFKFFDQIFYTNYHSWIQNYLLNQFETNKTSLISDGTAIFKIAELRKASKEIYFEGNKIFEKILNLSPIKNLHFYSPILLNVSQDDTLEVFSYKTSHTNRVNSKKVYIVGSPLLELGFVNYVRNQYYLQEIRKIYKDKDITYFAHRREKEESLKNYDFFDKVLRDNITFEERMEQEEDLPFVVISYFSSILINLPQIYPQVHFKYIPLTKADFLSEKLQLEYYDIKTNLDKINLPNLKPISSS